MVLKSQFRLQIKFYNHAVFSMFQDEHIYHVQQFLGFPNHAGATLKLKKCKFFTNQIGYLGHFIKPGRLEFRSHTMNGSHSLQGPSNASRLRSSLGFCNVFHQFVPNFAQVATPLNCKLRKYELCV